MLGRLRAGGGARAGGRSPALPCAPFASRQQVSDASLPLPEEGLGASLPRAPASPTYQCPKRSP